jgi:hypothetical protein
MSQIEELQAQIDALRSRLEGENSFDSELDADDDSDIDMNGEDDFDMEGEDDLDMEGEDDLDMEGEDDLDAELDADDEELEDDFEEDAINEAKRNKMNSIVESVVNSILNEDELHAWGKHPGYQKKPMELPSTGEDKNQWGEDWNDESVYSEQPFGTKIGDSTPFDKMVDSITKNVMDKLSESLNGGKKKVK